MLLLITFLACYIFGIRFFIIDTPKITIYSSNTVSKIDSIRTTINLENIPGEYYILVYDENPESKWRYYNVQNDLNREIINTFLPANVKEYVLFEGNKNISKFSFDIISTATVNYLNNNKTVFHLQLIIPYSPFMLPTFYFNSYYTFNIEPLL